MALGGAATWPLAAHGQQGERARRIGVIVPATADDPVWQARLGAFLQGLALLGWTIGRNAQIDIRWGRSNISELRRQTAEMAALAPDVILAGGDFFRLLLDNQCQPLTVSTLPLQEPLPSRSRGLAPKYRSHN
jgi:putative ABC transport system substrate-binding protein